MPPLTLPRFAAFGLQIASAVDLCPYAMRASDAQATPANLVVALGLEGAAHGDDSLDVQWPGFARVHFRGGREMWVEPVAGATPRALAELIAGPAMGAVLAQRGMSVLHASAVAFGGMAVALAGHSGAGKSTQAAMLVAAGGQAFSDDIVPLTWEGDRAMAVAGPTLAKLAALPDAVRAHVLPLGPEAAGEKQLYAWTRPAAPGERAQLAAVVLVEDGGEVALHRLRGQEAVAALLRFAFSLSTSGIRRQAVHLADAARLAAVAPVVRLVRPRTIGGASAAADALIQQVRTAWR
jgi:hypothetical protein